MTGGGHSRPGCGLYKRAAACPQAQPTLPGFEAHRVATFRKVCGRLECPECWESVADRAGRRVENILLEVKRLHGLRNPRHFQFSPAHAERWRERFAAAQTEEEWADVEMRFRRRAARMIERSGLIGGALLVHPWRCEEKDGGGQRYHQGARYLSPHVHYMGFGAAVTSSFFEKETGWVYTNLDDKNGRHVEVRDVRATVGYVLGHVGLGPGLRVTYIGIAAARCRELVGEEKREEPLVCKCGDQLLVYGVDSETGQLDWEWGPREPAWEMVRWRTYKLR